MYQCRVCLQDGTVITYRTYGDMMSHLGNVYAMAPFGPWLQCVSLHQIKEYVTSSASSSVQYTDALHEETMCSLILAEKADINQIAVSPLLSSNSGGRHSLAVSQLSQRMRDAIHLGSTFVQVPSIVWSLALSSAKIVDRLILAGSRKPTQLAIAIVCEAAKPTVAGPPPAFGT
jgi:hypothetical protein